MVKINSFELENVKRVRAVWVEPAENGLTIIGGKNGQGKTSVLDAIAWALGGDRFRPSQPQREGSVLPPRISVTLSNGLIVERRGKNSDLKVIDPSGRRAGQQLLNEFIGQFALDLPRFLQAGNKEKAEILLKGIGVGDRLCELERQEQSLYNQRHAVGQIADQKKKFAREMPCFEGVPEAPVSALELIEQQQDILAKNGENQKKRRRAAELETEKQRLRQQLDELEARYAQVCRDCETASRSAQELQDESTAQLEESIRNIDELNRKIRANLDREKAEADADACAREYDALSARLGDVRKAKTDLLAHADLPLAGLTVEKGALLYHGKSWDCMSGADQLRVATAIVKRLHPDCGFVLLDKLEQMDLDTLRDFGAWLEQEGLQAIATRVSTGGECSILLSDGEEANAPAFGSAPAWKAGEF